MKKHVILLILFLMLFVGNSSFNTLQAMPAKYSGLMETNIVADVAEKVASSVVNIDTEREMSQEIDLNTLPFGSDLFERFFFGNIPPGFKNDKVFKQKAFGNGSGVIFNKEGYILTCNHVIEGAQNIKVTLNNGEKYEAKVIGKDKYSDIAVIKIEAKNLTPVPLGNSSILRPGDWVLAVGSPLGYHHSVTIGIISAISRSTDISNVELIQTDASINPGNSGGPLVNLKGEVVGINNAIAGIGTGIGFAIPVNTVNDILQNLIANGSVDRPWIGIGMMNLEPNMAKSLGIPDHEKGVVINQVYPDSPADKAGFKQGDVIKKVDGNDVTEAKKIQDIVRSKSLDDEVNFLVVRNGRLMALNMKTGKMPHD